VGPPSFEPILFINSSFMVGSVPLGVIAERNLIEISVSSAD
jgi:hypothetical protein